MNLLKSKTVMSNQSKPLINGNLKEFDSKIPTNSVERKKYFDTLRKNREQAKKNIKNKNLDSKVNLKWHLNVLYQFNKRRAEINKPNAQLSFNAEYTMKKCMLNMEFIKAKTKIKKQGKTSFFKAFGNYKKSRKQKDLNSKEQATLKKQQSDLKAKYKADIAKINSLRSQKLISKSAAKGDKEKIKIVYKGDKKILSLQTTTKKKREDLIFSFWKMRKEIKKVKKLHKSKIEFLSNSIPTDCRFGKLRYLVLIAEFLFPGLGSLINRDYFKAFILTISTVIVYGLTIGFASGAFAIKINGEKQGGGLVGLGTLGNGSGTFQPDSRFFLVFGVISVMFVFITFVYSMIFARNAYKKYIAINMGYRGFGRLQLQKYLQQNGYPYMIATPIYLVILFTSVFPLLTSIIIVFTNYGEQGHIAPVNLVTWVGFDNLKEIFNFSGQEGKYFLKTLSWSFIWGIGATLTSMVAGVGLALLVNHPRIKGKKYIRVLFLLPTAIPFFIMVLYFKIFFGPTGTMNHDVMPVFAPWKPITTLEIAPGIRQDFTNYPWFSEVNRVKTLLFVINIWFGFAGMFLFITGLLQGLSKDLYEAAETMGAPGYKKFSNITAPIILYQISPILIGAFIGGFNNFGLIYLFTEGGPHISIGGPGETDILASYVFELVRDKGRPALAATYMFAIAILFGLFGLIGFSRTKTFRKGNY